MASAPSRKVTAAWMALGVVGAVGLLLVGVAAVVLAERLPDPDEKRPNRRAGLPPIHPEWKKDGFVQKQANGTLLYRIDSLGIEAEFPVMPIASTPNPFPTGASTWRAWMNANARVGAGYTRLRTYLLGDEKAPATTQAEEEEHDRWLAEVNASKPKVEDVKIAGVAARRSTYEYDAAGERWRVIILGRRDRAWRQSVSTTVPLSCEMSRREQERFLQTVRFFRPAAP